MISVAVGEKDDRSSNVAVLGVPDKDNELVDFKVTDKLDCWVTEFRRTGKSKPATTQPFSFRVTVASILQRATDCTELRNKAKKRASK